MGPQEARYTITINGVDYSIVSTEESPFTEGAVRRQAEFAYMGEEDLKSRPDTREWLHNSWTGGAQWEKPVYGRNNQDTYFESGDLSFTDRAGAVQQSAELQPLDSDLTSPSANLIAWSEDGVGGAITFVHVGAGQWQWHEWDETADAFVAISGRTDSHGTAAISMAASAGSDNLVYNLMRNGTVDWYDPTANTNGDFGTSLYIPQGSSMWVDRDFVWIYNGDKIWTFDIASTDTSEVQTVTSTGTGGTWRLGRVSDAGIGYTASMAWNISTAALATELSDPGLFEDVTVAGSPGAWVLTFIDPAGAVPLMVVDDASITGGFTWIEETTLGSVVYQKSEIAIADDDWGVDVLSRAGYFGAKTVIPQWACTRAISTSEGIFYVKNVLEGGLPVAKVFRVDRDASGSYILTPIGTLPKGQVALNIAHHLGSILVSTVPNYHQATLNVDDQKVTIYHVTGNSIGAIGSPLGGTNIDETPCWFLGSHDEMLYIGGRKRIWQYDGRVGSFHAVHVESDTKYTDHGAGFNQMVTVDSTSGAGLLMMHSSQDATSATPYFELLVEGSLITTSDDTAFVTSNWFDFDIPLEEKQIHEVFYDVSDVRTDSTITIQVSADGGAFGTVATITGGTSANTARVAVPTPITGYKFQYKLLFSTDTVTSSAEPGRLYSVGFGAFGGEMVDVLQFTIDGTESMNIENEVLSPEDVYANMKALRDTKETIVVSHTFNVTDGDDPQTNNYRVASVTGRKSSPQDGMYEIQLIEVP